MDVFFDQKLCWCGVTEHFLRYCIFFGYERMFFFPDTLGFFTPTDQDWPPMVRVTPILNWKYNSIWDFIRGLYLPYCSLYDRGWVGTLYVAGDIWHQGWDGIILEKVVNITYKCSCYASRWCLIKCWMFPSQLHLHWESTQHAAQPTPGDHGQGWSGDVPAGVLPAGAGHGAARKTFQQTLSLWWCLDEAAKHSLHVVAVLF